MQRVRQWLNNTSLTDPVERGQAGALQVMLMLIAGFSAFLFTLLVVAMLTRPEGEPLEVLVVVPLGLALLLGASAAGALLILRRGRFQTAVLLASLGFTALHGVTVIVAGLGNSELLMVYLVPLTLAGLLSSRRALPLALALACGAVWVAAFTTPAPQLPPGALPRPGDPSPPLVAAFNFTLLFGIAAVFFRVFGNVLADALTRALSRERELEELRGGLERTVSVRTADLQAALAEVEARATAQARLRHEAEEQREIVRRMGVPVLPISADTLVVPLVGELDGQRLGDLQEQALHAVERSGGRRLVLDITGVPVVDTHVAQGLVTVMQAVRLLGAQAVLVGIRPEVAQSLVSLGVSLQDLPTYADLQTALAARPGPSGGEAAAPRGETLAKRGGTWYHSGGQR